MKFSSTLIALSAAALATATPTQTLEKRAEICGQWDSVATGSYTLYQDLWGEDNASSGSQCSEVDSCCTDGIAWHTSWTWAGGSSDVKSFANVVTTITAKKVSAVSSIESEWDWSYTGTDIVADVAYDIFTSSTASGDDEYEIMIWLAALGGAGPISSTGSTVATPTIAGVSWELYSGYNGDTRVFSFVASSKQTSFSGDLLDFFTYLESKQSYSSSQYITSIGAGTEPFTGTDAVFTTTKYSCAMV
ncbi:MAG: hypothetical protein M1834_006056 [Cirrosporium novae-zelandiae]|nr:MAG: hypothetical protein M1834_006056 [Cirrosporium novae-zelandiae]